MTQLRLRSRQWIVDDQNRIIMGEGRKEILETIEKTGSIKQTAKLMKMSYKGVWSKIKVTEQYLNMSIVHTDRKMGSWLTEEGKELLKNYCLLKEACIEDDNRHFNRIFGGAWPAHEGERDQAAEPVGMLSQPRNRTRI